MTADAMPIELPRYPWVPVAALTDLESVAFLGSPGPVELHKVDAWVAEVCRVRAELAAAAHDAVGEDLETIAARALEVERNYQADLSYVSGYIAGRCQAITAAGPHPMPVPITVIGESDRHAAGRATGLREAAHHHNDAGSYETAAALLDAAAHIDPAKTRF